MSKKISHRLTSIVSMVLSVIMVLSSGSFTSVFADTLTQGKWTVENTGSGGVASFEGLDLKYYSKGTDITAGASGGMDYVRSSNSNGKAANGIVTTDDAKCSYVEFIPTVDGTLKAFIGNAPTKQGFVSVTAPDGTQTCISGTAGFYPCGPDNIDLPGFKLTQEAKWATIEMEVLADYKYYITVTGSKMLFYSPEFTPYVDVKGSINDAYNLSEYKIKFTNLTTGEAKEATVNGKSYSITLKPGYEYSASLSGEMAVEYSITADTRRVKVEPGNAITADLTIGESVSYPISGTISGMAGDIPADTKLTFIPKDTSFENVIADIDKAAKTYSARLAADVEYSLALDGAYDYTLSEAITVNQSTADPLTKNVVLKAVPVYNVSGKFLGLTQVRGKYETLNASPSAISFENVKDGYKYTGTVSNGTYSVSLRDGSYQASITDDGYSTSTHVTVNGGAVTRDLLLKDESPKTVPYAETLNVGADKPYKTVQAAVDAAAAMTRTAEQRVTIKIDPGTYREQVVINVPNITLSSNGGSRDDTKITWYYGIGYKYYSAVGSVYSPYADYDKFTKGDVVSYWGAAVMPQAGATGFRAENICFENSFNKYMTDEEIADGVEINGKESITVIRNEATDVGTKAATERAAALVNYADQVEFKDCSFLGSQDTLYTSNKSAFKLYFKNCYIEGQTDFICGTGDVIFDGCELNFCGYKSGASAGYLTANSCAKDNMASAGYIFRGCYVSYGSRDVTPGYYGRMWGDAAKVAFIDTQLQKPDMIVAAGWNEMKVKPDSPDVNLVEYNTTYNGEKIDTTGRVNGVKDTLDKSAYSVDSVFISKGWTPAYYTAAATDAPVLEAEPTFFSNGDLNTPNPGETVTLVYELGDKWAADDASIISWYAVEEGFDDSSLENLLKSATLLKTSSAVSSSKIQIPMECAGKYLMAVITPMTTAGIKGTPKFHIEKTKAVSNTWSDPDNQGSIAPGSGINVYLAGDSTVKDYSAKGLNSGGKITNSGSWGEFLYNFFDDRYVTVNNYANGGRSTRSFVNEGSLDKILANIKEGDYLFIQFGHNDCANGTGYDTERFVPLYTPATKGQSPYPVIKPEESMKTPTPSGFNYGATYYAWNCGATYKGFLQYYIDKTLEKGAVPVIVTPVSRLYYDYENGKIKHHHDADATDNPATMDYLTSGDAYVTACKEIYEANKDRGVLFLDAFNLTKSLYEKAYADCGSDAYGTAIMGVGDKTHSNKTGGVIQAGLIAKWIQEAGISISKYVVQPETAYGENDTHDFIFTIKDKKFTAKDNDYKENAYWTEYGQKLFDAIGSGETDPQPPVTDDEIKAEVSGSNITFIAGVDNLKYKETGFVFKSNGKEYTYSTNTVYTSIKGSAVKPGDIGKAFEYAYTITDVPSTDTQIEVIPYVVTQSGEKVLSSGKSFSLASVQ